jgi:hypothetical protein
MLITICNLSNFVFLTTPKKLENPQVRQKLIEVNREHPLTHYMICESDRLRVLPGSIVNDELVIYFTVMRQVSEFSWEDHHLAISSEICGNRCELFIKNSSICIACADGSVEVFDNVFVLLDWLGSGTSATDSLVDLLRLTVMYVGQTEINEKYMRFDGHEKLNVALSDVVEKRPHREVWVKLLYFQKPFLKALSLPEIESPFRADAFPKGGLVENIPVGQLKNAIEGVLIKYFQPPLNVQLKNNFPSDRHTSYKYFYELNIRSIIVELRGEWRSYVTGNDVAPYTKIKLIEYALLADDVGTFIHDNRRQDFEALLRHK